MPHRLALLVTAFALSAIPREPAARTDSRPALTGSIRGIVYDSLVANAPLPGAEVTVEGTNLAALTDRSGRFRIDSVPEGRVTLRFYHARLDSLGFGAAPVAVNVSPASAADVRLATPSPATFYAGLCNGRPAPSTGVLLGIVRNVDDRKPLPNADVEVAWAEWTFGSSGMVRNERRGTATTNANGAYALCGVPADVPVVARATEAGHITGLVELDFAQRIFHVRDFAVSLADSDATPALTAKIDSVMASGVEMTSRGSAAVVGTVRGADNQTLPDARVVLLGYPVFTVSNDRGEFALRNVPAGSQSFELRAIGYAPRVVTLDLRTGERRSVELALSRAAQELANVAIVGRGSRLDNTGFEDRRKSGVGYYLGPEELARRRVFDAGQLLWGVPGTRVVWDNVTNENVVLFSRPSVTGAGGGGFSSGCSPAVFIDGFPAFGINDVRPDMIRAMEIYREPAAAPPIYRSSTSAPAVRPGASGVPGANCAIVLVWTKPPEPRLKR